MYALSGLYIYTPPIHQYPSNKFTFSSFLIPFLSLLVSLSIIHQPNFLVFLVHVFPSLRSRTFSIFSVFSCPLFCPWYFHLIQSSSIIFQFSNDPVLYSSKAATSIPFIPVFISVCTHSIFRLPSFLYVSLRETVSLVLFFRFTSTFSCQAAVFPWGSVRWRHPIDGTQHLSAVVVRVRLPCASRLPPTISIANLASLFTS